MRKMALAVTLVALAAPAAAKEPATAPDQDPMAGWVPRKPTKEAQDKKEIQALLKALDDAARKGDLDAAVALIDFPVLMVTDNAKGEAMADVWDREKWTQTMAPFYKKPMPDVKMTHKPTIFVITDSLASVGDQQTMTHGKKTVSYRSSSLVIRKEGKWLVKSMVEGGWGDTALAKGASASPAAPSETGAQPAAGAPPDTGGESDAGAAPSEPQEAPDGSK